MPCTRATFGRSQSELQHAIRKDTERTLNKRNGNDDNVLKTNKT